MMACGLSEDDKLRLSRGLESLLADAEPQHLVVHLIASGVFNDEDKELIDRELARSLRVYKMTQLYQHKATDLEPLKNALLKDGQEHLVQFLEQTHADYGKGKAIERYKLRPKLVLGRVPNQPAVYVPRQQQLQLLKENLVSLVKYDTFWLVLHGMGGCGKTTLAAECVRDDPDILGPNYNYVIFHTLEIRVESQKKTLLTDLRNIYVKLTKFDHCRHFDNVRLEQSFDNIEQATDSVRQLILDYFPYLLLVVDDFWTEEAVRIFNELQCRILAITRKPTLFQVAQNANIRYVSVEPSGFTNEEGMNLFAKYARRPVDQLPLEAKTIFNLCDGHPLMLNIIGSLIQEHNDRWSIYCSQLREQSLDEMAYRSNYKHSTFNKAADLSYQDLPTDLQRKYKSLAIFPLGVLIPDSVLATLWIVSGNQWVTRLVHVQDAADELKYRSLLQDHPEEIKKDSLRRHRYTVHSLLHTFLKRTVIKDAERQEMTSLLVSQLSTALKNQNSNFEDYIPIEDFLCRFIGYFLFKAKMLEEFPNWYLNLNKLSMRLRYVCPSLLLAEFCMYDKYIGRWDSRKKDEFSRFLRRNAKFSSYSGLDLVQLGLMEPTTSSVYRQALRLATESMQSDDQIFYLIPKLCPGSVCECSLNCWMGIGPITSVQRYGSSICDGQIVVIASRDDARLLICCSRNGYVLEMINLSSAPISVAVNQFGDIAVCTDTNELHIYRPDQTALSRYLENLEISEGDPSQKTPSPVMRFLSSESTVGAMDVSLDPEDFSSLGEQIDARKTFDVPALIINCDNKPQCCALSFDGSLVAVLIGKTVQIWNLNSSAKEPVKSYHLKIDERGDMEYKSWIEVLNENGIKLVAVGVSDSHLQIWNMTTDEQIAYLLLTGLAGFKFTSTNKMLTVTNKEICSWRIDPYTPSQSLEISCPLSRGTVVLCLDVSLCGRYVAIGVHDFTVQIFRLSDTAIDFVTLLRWHSGWVQSVCFSNNTKHLQLYSAGEDETLVAWNLDNIVQGTNSQTESVSHVDVREYYGHLWIATADVSGRITVRPAESFSDNEMNILQIGSIKKEENSKVTSLALSKTQMKLAVAYSNCVLDIHDFNSNEIILSWSCKTESQIARLLFSPLDTRLGALQQNGTRLEVIHIGSHKRYSVLNNSKFKGQITKFMFDPTGNILYAATDEAEIMGADLTGTSIQMLTLDSGWIFDFDISSDNKWMILGCANAARIHSLPSLTFVCYLSCEIGGCYRAVALLSRSKDCLAAVTSDDGSITVHQLDTERQRKLSCPSSRIYTWHNAHKSWITGIKFSSDGRYLVSLSRALNIWRLDPLLKEKPVQSYPLVGSYATKLFVSNNFDAFSLLDAFARIHFVQKYVL